MTNRKRQKTQLFVERISNTCKSKVCSPAEIKVILSGFSNSDFKEIFSDPYWDNYPTFVYSSRRTDINGNIEGKIHGQRIWRIISNIISNQLACKDTLYKYSCGILLKYAIHFSPVTVREELIRRGLKSRDSRVRKISVKYAKMKDVILALSDKNSSIRCAAKSRILNDGPKYIHLLDDERDLWHQMKAYPSFVLSKEEVQSRLDKYLILQNTTKKRWHNYMYSQIITNLLSRLDNDNLLFYINLVNAEQQANIKDLIYMRIGA